jgi:hypothetical protein
MQFVNHNTAGTRDASAEWELEIVGYRTGNAQAAASIINAGQIPRLEKQSGGDE